MRVWKLALAASVFACSAAHADMSGNALRQHCADFPEGTPETGICVAYISGSLDAFRSFEQALSFHAVCIPTGVTGEQLTAMTVKYLNDHPEQWHYNAASLVVDMLMGAFPCPKNSK